MTIIITPEQFEMLLPLACAWAEEQERVILQTGDSLSMRQLADARSVGVMKPERVRLLRVKKIPTPSHPALAVAVEATRLISSLTVGLALRYGIFIRNDFWWERHLVVHELAHTMQYERLGSIQAFLRQYLHECLTIGYPEAPMEQEAKRIEREFFLNEPKYEHKRYPLNAEGDFYVEDELCITCGAPEGEAPTLVGFHETSDKCHHCYFKKQPETLEEIKLAVSALRVSCVEALRYGGKDKQIIEYLKSQGLGRLCDHLE